MLHFYGIRGSIAGDPFWDWIIIFTETKKLKILALLWYIDTIVVWMWQYANGIFEIDR